VSELSLNEVESLALKVGRGAGFSWGLAEDIGRGARALARDGSPWAEALVALARGAESWQAPSRVQLASASEFGSAAPLCPVRIAARLLDDPSVLREGPLRIANVAVPLWIEALFAASANGREFDVAWPGGWLAPAADVTIAPLAASWEQAPRQPRAHADARVLAVLGAVAARVYVPASDSSRAKGAGGGSVDDD
jgi:hypothetical protein